MPRLWFTDVLRAAIFMLKAQNSTHVQTKALEFWAKEIKNQHQIWKENRRKIKNSTTDDL